MPKVSVIVPNYNHAKYLSQRLDSIFDQTFQDFEVILLDDCSTDNSVELLTKYTGNKKVTQFIVNEKNSGSTYKQWTKGITLAKGEYIWIAESDDIANSDFIEVAMQSLNIKNCSVFFTQSWIIDEQGNLQGKWNQDLSLYENDFIIYGNELIQEYMVNENIIPNASAVVFAKNMIKQETLECMKSFMINGDWFLWINLLENNNCVFKSMPLNFFRRHTGAGSIQNVLNFINIEEAFWINKFLSKKGYKIDSISRMNSWVDQANYSIIKIFSRNFINIYRQALSLYPYPLIFILRSIFRKKIKRFIQ